MPESPIIIVGGGMAGYAVAREFRKRDAESPVTLITTDDGGVYSKPMLSNALGQGKTADDLVQKTAQRIAADLAISVRPHCRVTAIDRDAARLKIETPTGADSLAYGKLVLAVGATPRPYRVEGAPDGLFAAVNTLDDYRQWRAPITPGARLLIVGAGLIGVEFANDLLAGGYRVDLVDPARKPLSRLLPDALGDLMETALSESGATLHMGRTIASIDKTPDGYQATLDDGRTVAFDHGLAAIGLIPRTGLAVAAGLTVNGGIVVDHHLATSDLNIFALGDCAETPAGLLPFVLPLMASARALAATLAGEPTPLHLPALPVTVKTPALPTVVCPPKPGRAGAWQITGDGRNRSAVFRDAAGAALGFALTGDQTKARMAVAKTMPDLLAA